MARQHRRARWVHDLCAPVASLTTTFPSCLGTRHGISAGPSINFFPSASISPRLVAHRPADAHSHDHGGAFLCRARPACFRTRAPTSPCPWRLLDCLSDTGTTHEIAQRGARTASGTLRCGWRMLHRTHSTPPACCRSLAWSRVESMDDACGRPTRLPAGCCCCLTMGLLLWSRACCVSRASRAGWQCEKPLRKRSEETDAMASDCLSSLNRDFNWQSEIG
ncbi:uncharacterized protein BKA78DRAFT_144826 [Phyllosticta capitalensis]|uniref:uncharacterized protein n=1 Tax=Phyllosticta capitalensis TaxID=121624 RepID=UPI00312EBAF0